MAVAEEIGHNHNGGQIFRWDYENSMPTNELWDDIPLIINEVESGIESKFTFSVDSKIVLEKDIFVPRYYWSNKQKEVESIAKNKKLSLISIQQLINEGIITTFDGHGSPKSEYKGMGETPYIRVKDIVNWEIYKDPTAMIPEEIALNMKSEIKELLEEDVVYVKRGSYRIGSSAMVSPFDINVVLTREILVLRVQNLQNKYNLDPYYLIYLLNHPLVAMQTKNKVFIETTLPNIGHRWREVFLPISNNVEYVEHVKSKVKSAIKSKWSAVKDLKSLEQKF
jgi:type I restriction enzyme M protein